MAHLPFAFLVRKDRFAVGNSFRAVRISRRAMSLLNGNDFFTLPLQGGVITLTEHDERRKPSPTGRHKFSKTDERTAALRQIAQLSLLPKGWRLPLPDGVAIPDISTAELWKRLQTAVAIAEAALRD
jgi:hypothetical protein